MLYYVLTTGAGQQTLGEEYCDITQVCSYFLFLQCEKCFWSTWNCNLVPLYVYEWIDFKETKILAWYVKLQKYVLLIVTLTMKCFQMFLELIRSIIVKYSVWMLVTFSSGVFHRTRKKHQAFSWNFGTAISWSSVVFSSCCNQILNFCIIFLDNPFFRFLSFLSRESTLSFSHLMLWILSCIVINKYVTMVLCSFIDAVTLFKGCRTIWTFSNTC